MAYYEDRFGNWHYHEPLGAEDEWVVGEGNIGDPSLAQIKKEDVTSDFIKQLSEVTTLKFSGNPTTSIVARDPDSFAVEHTETEPVFKTPIVPDWNQNLTPIGEVNTMSNGNLFTLPWSSDNVPGIQDNIPGGIAGLLPLMLLFGGGSGGSGLKKMLTLMLMMPMIGGMFGMSASQQQQATTVALLPGIGLTGKMLLGGVGALVADKFINQPKRRRRRYSRPRTIVVNRPYYNRYRRY